MEDLSPRPGDLDPIEIASRDEIEALQFHRMKWSLRHAYDNSPSTGSASIEHGVHPDDLKSLADLAKFPFTTKPTCATPIPSACSPCRASKMVRIHASSGTTGKPTVVGYTAADIDTWANLIARRSARRAGGPAISCMSPMATACSPAGLARITGPRTAGLHRGADLGRDDRAAGDADHDFKPRIIMVTPSYMLSILDEFRRQGSTRARARSPSASSAPSPGPTPCAPRSNRRSTCTPSTSTACPR
jgi:phenylacetate-CoA ligase